MLCMTQHIQNVLQKNGDDIPGMNIKPDCHGTYILDENPMKPPVLSEYKPQAMDKLSIRCQQIGAGAYFQRYICS